MGARNELLDQFHKMNENGKLTTLIQAAKWRERQEADHQLWAKASMDLSMWGAVFDIHPVGRDYMIAVIRAVDQPPALQYIPYVHGVCLFEKYPCFDAALIAAVTYSKEGHSALCKISPILSDLCSPEMGVCR